MLYREILERFVTENLLIKISECQSQVTLSIFHRIIHVFDFHVKKYRIRSRKFTELYLSCVQVLRNICTFVSTCHKNTLHLKAEQIISSKAPFKNKILLDVSLIKCQARWHKASIFISPNKYGIRNNHSNVKG